MTPTFQGEVQLRRWSESSTQGVQVTFALADADDLEPLKIKSGKRFMAVLVEIGDDETPVQPNPDPQLNPLLNRDVGPLCKWLVMRCKEPEFWAWMNNTFSCDEVTNAHEAAETIKFIMCIESRKEIDASPKLTQDFHKMVREPYQKWLVRRQG